jgi:hypothetical protein
VDLIFGTCCLAGAPSVIADFSDEDTLNAIGEHDTAALFNMLVVAFSHQGTSRESRLHQTETVGGAGFRNIRRTRAAGREGGITAVVHLNTTLVLEPE